MLMVLLSRLLKTALGLVTSILIVGLRLYKRWLSPLLPPSCRYHPSCSTYAEEALLGHGLFCGSWLSAKRIVRCNQFFEGGIDPVPPRNKPTLPL